MSKITPISSSGKKTEMCQYCGLVPQAEHPGYSCPRIDNFAWADGEFQVQYVDLVTFTQWAEHRELRKAAERTSEAIS